MRTQRHPSGPARSLLPVVVACCAIAMLASHVGRARGATSSVVVTVTVPSATNLDATACATGAPATSFGNVLPGSLNVTSADCHVVFGSSNDNSMLRISQSDTFGTGMWMPTAGALDGGFNGGGTQVIDFAVGSQMGTAAFVQPDGKTIVVGSDALGTGDLFMARLTATGGLDGGFNGSGKNGFDIGTSAAWGTTGVLQPDGRMLVAGSAVVAGNDDAVVARLTATGGLDGSFGTGGKFTFPLAAGNDWIHAMALQPDGRILLGGWASYGAGKAEFAIARLTAAGALDTTFGTGGVTLTQVVANNVDQAFAMALQPDGKVVLAGSSKSGATTRIAVVRYLPTGALDLAGFGGGTGMVTTNLGSGGTMVDRTSTTVNDGATGVVVQPDGMIVVSATGPNGANDQWVVARYSAAGVLDPGFGAAGVATFPALGSSTSGANAVALQPDGRILVTGSTLVGGTERAALARLTVTGALDTTFNATGWTTTVFPTAPTRSVGFGVTFGDDGQVLVAGVALNGANPYPVVARYGSTTVADYLGGSADWSAGANAFGVCLRAVGTGASTDGTTWAPDGTCAAANGPNWHAVPTTSAKVAASTVATTQTGAADLRFGFRVATNQPPGTYLAPVTFDVLAPNV